MTWLAKVARERLVERIFGTGGKRFKVAETRLAGPHQVVPVVPEGGRALQFLRSCMVALLLLTFLPLGVNAQTEATKPVDGRLEISLWYSLPSSQAKVLEDMVAEFQASHPYVRLVTKNHSTPDALYRALISGKSGPTLAIMETSWLPDISGTGKLYQVEQWMPREQFVFNWSIKCNIYGPLWQSAHVGEDLMALPMFFTTRALIYNGEMFKEAGIANTPVTWEQLAETAAKLADPEHGVWGFALSVGASVHERARNLQVLAWQAGGELATSTGQTKGTGAAERALDFLAQLTQTQQASPDLGTPVLASQVAMFPGNVADFLELRKQGLPVKVASLPGPDKANRTTEVQVWALGMFQVPDGQLYKVQELAFWLTDFPQQRHWAEQTSYLAAHVKVFDNPFYRRHRLADHAGLRVFVNVLGSSRPVDTAGRATSTLDVLGKQIPDVLRGDKTSRDFFGKQVGARP